MIHLIFEGVPNIFWWIEIVSNIINGISVTFDQFYILAELEY